MAFLPVDIDRRYIRDPSPSHAALLGNLLKWCAGETVPFEVEGPGYVGSYLYRQGDRLILHLINGSGVDNGDEITDQYYPVGPLRVRVKLPPGAQGNVRSLVEDKDVPQRIKPGVVEFEIARLVDHEVIVIE